MHLDGNFVLTQLAQRAGRAGHLAVQLGVAQLAGQAPFVAKNDGGAIIAYGPNGDTIELAGVDPEAIGLTHFRFNYTDSDSVYLGG